MLQTNDNLYLIMTLNESYCKIGRSSNPKKRFRQIATSCPERVYLNFDLEGLGHLEKDLHKLFSNLRLNGEWFKYDKSIFYYFVDLTFIHFVQC